MENFNLDSTFDFNQIADNAGQTLDNQAWDQEKAFDIDFN